MSLMEMFNECIMKNGGSDIIVGDGDGDGDDPGQREIFHNLNTVSDKWYEVPIEEVKFIIPSGKPPSNISSKQWKEIEERSIAFGKVVEKKLPVIWLLLEMKRLRIDEELLQKKIVEFDNEVSKPSPATSADEAVSVAWVNAVMKYNGYAKILKELHRFAKDDDGQPLPFCYDFYQQREADSESLSSTFSEYSPFDDDDETEIKSDDDCDDGDSGDDDQDKVEENKVEDDEVEEDEDCSEKKKTIVPAAAMMMMTTGRTMTCLAVLFLLSKSNYPTLAKMMMMMMMTDCLFVNKN